MILCPCRIHEVEDTLTEIGNAGLEHPTERRYGLLRGDRLLSLTNIGSTTALLAIVTLTIGSVMSSYVITIGCLLLKRIRGEPLPPHRWTLDRFGIVINIAALAFLLPVFVFAFFPLTSSMNPESMN